MTESFRGNKTGRPVTLVVRDGMSLSSDDLFTVEAYFGSERAHAPLGDEFGIFNGRLSVIVLYRSRLTSDPPALKAAGYDRLPFIDDREEVEHLAKVYGAEIFGTTTDKVSAVSRRAPNGETFVFAHCHPDDFTKTRARKSL